MATFETAIMTTPTDPRLKGFLARKRNELGLSHIQLQQGYVYISLLGYGTYYFSQHYDNNGERTLVMVGKLDSDGTWQYSA